MSNQGPIAVERAVPDFVELKQLKFKAFEMCDEVQDEVTPGVKDLCRQFKEVLLATDRSLREAVLGGTVLLGNKLFALPAEATVPTGKIAEASTLQATLCGELAQQTLRLELLSWSAVDQQVVWLEQSVADLNEEGTPAELRLEKLQQQHADIVAAIDAFETPTVYKAFKGLIPSEEDIDAAFGFIKNPKVDAALLKQVRSKLLSHVEVLEGASTFSELTQVRDRLCESIHEAKQLCEIAQRRKDKAMAELESTRALAGIGSIKDCWLQSARKVEAFWQSCSDTLTAGVEPEKALIVLEDLYRYLLAVQKAFERA